MTSASSAAANVTTLTALMNTGRRSAFRARAVIHAAGVGDGGPERRRVERCRWLIQRITGVFAGGSSIRCPCTSYTTAKSTLRSRDGAGANRTRPVATLQDGRLLLNRDRALHVHRDVRRALIF